MKNFLKERQFCKAYAIAINKQGETVSYCQAIKGECSQDTCPRGDKPDDRDIRNA